MDNRTTCPVCRAPNANYSGAGTSTAEVHCPRCGRFQVQTLAETQLMNSPPAFPPAHILSGLCRNTWEQFGEKLLIGAVTRMSAPTACAKSSRRCAKKSLRSAAKCDSKQS